MPLLNLVGAMGVVLCVVFLALAFELYFAGQKFWIAAGLAVFNLIAAVRLLRLAARKS